MSLRHPTARAVAAASVAWMGWVALGPAASADDIVPGSYCRLPEPGEEPECLKPARQEYGGFFSALAQGQVDDDDASRVEAAVVDDTGSEGAYLALSSMSYGYYVLAQRVAAEPNANPALVARLERWNGLLAHAFESSADDSRYRNAVREAARDLHGRTRVRVGCADARGNPAECDSTESVLRGFDATSHDMGIRGALERLIERMSGAPSS
jgi:hypothetical protein